MGWNSRKVRRRALQRRILERVARDPDLLMRHQQKRWTRRWRVVERCVLWSTGLIATVVLVVITALCATFLNGVQEIGSMLGARVMPQPSIVPLLAGWILVSFAFLLVAAMRIRRHPTAPGLTPWAIHLPLADRRLIAPGFYSFLGLALPMLIISLGAFSLTGYCLGWGLREISGLGLVWALSWATGWVLAEWFAWYLPPTPLIQTSLVLTLLGIFALLIGIVTVPRDVVREVTQVETYGTIWNVPPTGWYIGWSGLLPATPFRNFWLPCTALCIVAVLALCVRQSLQLQDIQLGGGGRIQVGRRHWLQSWKKTRQVSQLARYVLAPDKALLRIHRLRVQLLATGRRSWSQRWMFPMQLSSRQLACLGLLGLRYPRRGRPREFAWGMFPVVLAMGLLIANQFMSLASFPRFLRLPMLFGFGLALIDQRELFAGQDKQEVTAGFSIARSVFPFTFNDILISLWLQRSLIVWCALPGYACAVGILLCTDLPRAMIWNGPALLVVISYLNPFLVAVAYSSSNLRASWQTWLLFVVPWLCLLVAGGIALFVGVFGYYLAMRPDAAWAWTAGLVATLVPAALISGWALNKGRLDEGVVQLGKAIGRR